MKAHTPSRSETDVLPHPGPLHERERRFPNRRVGKAGHDRADLEIGAPLHFHLRRAFESTRCSFAILLFVFVAFTHAANNDGYGPSISVPRELPKQSGEIKRTLVDQTRAEAHGKSAGCLECHKGIDRLSMHLSDNVVLGCTDCHGGDATPGLTMRKAHVVPTNKTFWESSANPSDSSILLNYETARVRSIRESRRLARGRAGMRKVPCQRSRAHAQQHDASRRDALGRGALQQRRVPAEKLSLRPGLWSERRNVAAVEPLRSNAGRNAHEWRAAVSRSIAALRAGAAEQHSPHLRKRRREAASTGCADYD